MKLGIAGKLASLFVNSKLTPLIIIASLLLGAFAVMKTPREEEPQIIVPMADVIVSMPGASSHDIERRVTTPMEQLIWEIPGVEYVYSTSMPGSSMVVVRFLVGQDQEAAYERLRDKLHANFDIIPRGCSEPIIKPRSIDDVPILAMTLHSSKYDDLTLRQIAAAIQVQIKQLPNVSETHIIGGRRREMDVKLDRAALAAYGLTLDGVSDALQTANQRLQTGAYSKDDRSAPVASGQLVRSKQTLGDIVVGQSNGQPVLLKNVANLTDGPEEPKNYVLFGHGGEEAGSVLENAVTLSVAKRQGKNAIEIAEEVIKKVDALKGSLVPKDVQITITRNYGETASEKSNELLLHMMIAVVSVTLLIAVALGRKESLVVLVAIPVTLGLTLLMFYLYGYTLNRITLFALIFSIGILVDDAIVVVENIVRHYRMPDESRMPPLEAAIHAVDEVGNPTILATFAVIAAILPMAFVGGLMGPYMRPIPVGASAAMLFSLIVAFIVTPWAALRLLKSEHGKAAHSHGEKEDWSAKLYKKIMCPLLDSRVKRNSFLGGVLVLLVAACSLVGFKLVIVKMLPFDNKNEFQIIVDMPQDATLERTLAASKALAQAVSDAPEVENFQIYAGTASPYTFNGLVRHYFNRSAAFQADVQVNLLPKNKRKAQSHAIAKRLRPAIEKVAKEWGVRVKISEVPPGPPVLQTLVAEIYGPTPAKRTEVAQKIKQIFHDNPNVVDVDWYQDDPIPVVNMRVDREKAALLGVDTASVNRTMATALSGAQVGLLGVSESREDIPIRVTIPRAQRAGADQLSQLTVMARDGHAVPLQELVMTKMERPDLSIYHKNLMPVVYVTGDVGGHLESPVYAILGMNESISALKLPDGKLPILTVALPTGDDTPSLKWDGEWYITYEVFRDLGIAFAVVLVLIYILVVAWFQDFMIPLVIMAPIPLTLVGILPAHALMGAFFTATSMIGFIAGAGIIVRNSIILVDFIELRIKQGLPLREAVIDAGTTRFRPMLLTAAAVIVGSSVILFDPIFQGLAIALMAGEIASTLLSRFAVPVLYYILRVHAKQPKPAIAGEKGVCP
ncbi:MAG: efflux RND transporter permease subunit [Armatimonadota bacterium]